MAQSLLFASTSCSSLPSRTQSFLSPFRPSVATCSFNSASSLALAQCKSSKRSTVRLGAKTSTIRCEQGTKNTDGLDVWLSRGAMLAFTAALTIELSTGKGVLENLGFTAPLPAVALALTALVGAGAAFFIFQSASSE